MSRVLLTAYEPYDEWEANASWLALVELTRELPVGPELTTRLYPVDFSRMRERLAEDLAADFDFALHLGQSPRSTCLDFERVGLNISGPRDRQPEEYEPLVAEGPVAVQCPLPIGKWVNSLREIGVPARVSYYAGTYLCNAALYHSCHLSQVNGYRTRSAFIHIPLDTEQVLQEGRPDHPSLPRALVAVALRHILEQLLQSEEA